MLTQTVEYALRAVADLAKHHPEPRTTQEVAEATRVPPDYLSKVLKQLANHGLVRSQRGLHGGFSLLHDPRELMVHDVVHAMNPLQRIRECPLGIEEHTSLCPLHRLLDDALAQVEETFRSVSISDLLETGRGRSALCPANSRSVAPTVSVKRGRRPKSAKNKPPLKASQPRRNRKR